MIRHHSRCQKARQGTKKGHHAPFIEVGDWQTLKESLAIIGTVGVIIAGMMGWYYATKWVIEWWAK